MKNTLKNYDNPSSTAENRTIVLIGKVGSGKSSVGNCILGRKLFHVKNSISGVTNNCRDGDGQMTINNVDYLLHIVDTPGIYDPERSNDELLEEIQNFVSFRNPGYGIHLFLFILSFHRATEEEINSMSILLDKFGDQISPFSALVYTHCEGFTEEKKEEMKAEVLNSKRMGHIASKMGKGVFFLGFPDYTETNDTFKKSYAEINRESRDILLNLISSCNESFASWQVLYEMFNREKQIEKYTNYVKYGSIGLVGLLTTGLLLSWRKKK